MYKYNRLEINPNMATTLVKVLSVEVAFVRSLGFLPFKLSKDQKWFTYSKCIFCIHLIGIIPITFGRLWFQTDKSMIPYDEKNPKAIVATAMYNFFLVSDAYLTAFLIINRLYSRHRFGETYNNLLDIDYKIHHLNQTSTYVEWIKKSMLEGLFF